jgi:IS5 family transposase
MASSSTTPSNTAPPPTGRNLRLPSSGSAAAPAVCPARSPQTAAEGRISYLKRGYGWDRTRLDSRHGAAIWCGHGVFAHNLIKIGALAN